MNINELIELVGESAAKEFTAQYWQARDEIQAGTLSEYDIMSVFFVAGYLARRNDELERKNAAIDAELERAGKPNADRREIPVHRLRTGKTENGKPLYTCPDCQTDWFSEENARTCCEGWHCPTCDEWYVTETDARRCCT